MSSPAGPMSAADWARLLLLGAIWGASFFFARVAVSEVAPLALVLLRVGIAAAALHLWLLVAGPSFRLALPHLGAFAVLALLNNVVPFGLIFTGQTAMGAGLASVLNATTPFWTLILASRLTADEPLRAHKLIGVGLGVAGTAVMVGPDLAGTASGSPLWAKLALVGAALSYALALIFARRFRAVPPLVVATGQLTLATLITAPLALLAVASESFLPRTGPVWSAVIALALVSTAFAYGVYFRVLATAGAANASLVTLIVPASAILLGAVFLDEKLQPVEAAGLALIAVGLVAVDGRILRSLARQRS